VYHSEYFLKLKDRLAKGRFNAGFASGRLIKVFSCASFKRWATTQILRYKAQPSGARRVRNWRIAIGKMLRSRPFPQEKNGCQ
jgi:hypothetical protein